MVPRGVRQWIYRRHGIFCRSCGADEEQAAGSDDRAAVIFGAGIFQALGGEFGIFAERNFPDKFAGVEIDSVERAPRGRYGRVAIGIEKAFVAGEVVLHERRFGLVGFEFLTYAVFR